MPFLIAACLYKQSGKGDRVIEMETPCSKPLATLSEIAKVSTTDEVHICDTNNTGSASLQVRVAALLTSWGMRAQNSVRTTLKDEEGQGTTEYAILVGVLVVIAIVAILAFRDRIQTLWTSIADGINQL